MWVKELKCFDGDVDVSEELLCVGMLLLEMEEEKKIR